MSMRIARLEGAGPAPALASLHREGFPRPWDAADFAALLADATVVAHGLRLGPTFAGFALSRRVLDEAEILTLAVAAAERGRGLGRALLGAHLADLIAGGARSVHLEVAETNAPARALYAGLGFSGLGSRPAYYPAPAGGPGPALRLALAVPEGRPAPAGAGMDRPGRACL